MKEVADLFLLCIAFLALIFASITDIKKQEVPNWLNFGLLAIALGTRGIASLLLQDFSYFYWALIAVAVFYVLGHLFVYTRIFGGGDAKLLISLSACFATVPFFAKPSSFIVWQEPFLMTFLINVLFIGACAGILVSIFYFFRIKNKKQFFRELLKFNKSKGMTWMKVACFILALGSMILLFLIQEKIFIIIALVILILPYLHTFLKTIELNCFIRLVNPKKLAEGDYLLHEIKIGKNKIKPRADGLNSSEIAMLRKAKKKIWIKLGIAGVPFILLSLIISLFFGNILLEIIRAFFF